MAAKKKISAKKIPDSSLAAAITYLIAQTDLGNSEIAERLWSLKKFRGMTRVDEVAKLARNVAWYRSRMNAGKLQPADGSGEGVTWKGGE